MKNPYRFWMERLSAPALSKVIPIGALVLTLPFDSALFAQDEDDEDGEVFTLSAFTVDASKDVGYRSTNSTSGTSLNTPLKEIPMSIEVINEDFLEDIGATDFDESLKYSAGIFTDSFIVGTASGENSNGTGESKVGSGDKSASSSAGLGGRFDNGVTIRGFNTVIQNREGFRYGGLIANYGASLGGVIDTSNVSRLEVVRGPNSLLYGIGVLSGIVNVIAKRPLSEKAYDFSLTVGSNDFKRGTWEVTGPLMRELWGGQLNYRFAGAVEERGDWTEFYQKNLEYFAGQLEYKSDRWTVFLEGQHMFRKDEGIGATHIHDNTAASDLPSNRNEYGQQWNWQREGISLDASGEPIVDSNGFFTHDVDMGEGYRITGPDTYDQRKETDWLATVAFHPNENFTLDAGVFFTEAEEELFDVSISTLNNQEVSTNLRRELILRGLGNSDPDVVAETETFRDSYVRTEVYGFVDEDSALDLDNRVVRYWWSKTPEVSTTEQYRIRAKYSFETSDFFGDSKAKHLFLVGRHDIKDEVDIVTGQESIQSQYWNTADRQGLFEDNEISILKFRSIDDQTPILFNSETDSLAQPGSDFRNLEVWYAGHYGMYQGSFLNEKLGVILGIRHDRYHSRERLYDRYVEEVFNPVTPASEGPNGIPRINPDNQTFGFLPFGSEAININEYRPGAEAETELSQTIALSYNINEDFSLHVLRAEGITPNTGLRDGANQGIPSERTLSEEVSFKFETMGGKLSGAVAVYRITRENAVYALLGAPSPIRWFGGDAPGSAAEDRDVLFDPTLKHVIGDGLHSDASNDGQTVISYGINNKFFEDDGVVLGPFAPEGTRNRQWPEGVLGRDIFDGGATPVVFLDYSKLDTPVFDSNGDAVIRDGEQRTWRYYIEEAWEQRSNQPLNGVIDSENFWAFRDAKVLGSALGNHPGVDQSQTGAANVTYTDEATGYDISLIYQPNRNLQFVFSFAHTEREVVSPFKLAENIDIETGEYHGTEYDPIVRVLGRDRFGLEETLDANGNVVKITKTGSDEVLENGDVKSSDLFAAVEGLSLFDGSEDAGSILAKYSFTEGKLDGFATTLGLIYKGEARTSFSIGGFNLENNRFGTPPTPEQFTLNLGFSYVWNAEKFRHSFQLNINNLLDETYDANIATYDDDGETIQRITEIYRSPRELRFSWNVGF